MLPGLGRRWIIAALLSRALVSEGQDVIHVVDVPQIVCSGGAGKVELNITVNSNPDQPHVLTFFRTAPEPVSVSFKMTTATGYPVIDEQTVELAGHGTSRRLSEASVTASAEPRNCEEFFLLDGRDPVDLPDTWREARDGFLQLCEAEGTRPAEVCRTAEQEAFRDYPERTQQPFSADERLCMRLLRHAPGMDQAALAKFFGTGALPAAALPRRTKGATSSGGTAAGSYSSKNSGAGTYTYSTARMSSMYSSGYTSTGYGYSGRTAAVPSRVVGTYYVIGWWGARPMFWGSRRYTHCHDGSGQSCDSSSRVDCESGEKCDWSTLLGDEAVRDDLMQTGFKPANHRGPFTLTITGVSGDAFASTRICPPSGWEPTGPSSSSWAPPESQDLFAALSNAEGFVDEELNHWTWLAPVLTVLICCCLCCCVCKRPRKASRDAIFEDVQAERLKGQGDNSKGVIPKDFELSGADCRYTLHVLADGSLTGSSVCNGNTFKVEGVLSFVSGEYGSIYWLETQGPLSREVQGNIQRTPVGFSVNVSVYAAWEGTWDQNIVTVSLQSFANSVAPYTQEGMPTMGDTAAGAPAAFVFGTPLTNHAGPQGGLRNCATGLTNHAAAATLPGEVYRVDTE